jgi:prepilin-type N-terminal cleavage/methylation domain-containing protein
MGFTLIEVVMAVVIAGIILIPLLSVFITATTRNVDQEAAGIGLHLAAAKLEIVSNKSFTNIISEPLTSFGSPFTDFDSEVIVNFVAADAPDVPVDPAQTSYKRISVRVTSALLTAGPIEVVSLVTDVSNE